MSSDAAHGLNDSGEILLTRIVECGAVHISRCERTHPHAHYAWKILVGLDAPVRLECALGRIDDRDEVHAVVVPPGLQHQVAAIGWSCAMFTAPGSRGTPWHTATTPWVPEPAVTRRLVRACAALVNQARQATPDFVDDVYREVFGGLSQPRVDARVKRALQSLKTCSEASVIELASAQHLSPDRLSHLVKQETGMVLRKHLIWSRLVALLSQDQRYPTLAAAAAAAGFSDHAHLTRSYRSYLGRLPSDFSGPPDVLQAW